MSSFISGLVHSDVRNKTLIKMLEVSDITRDLGELYPFCKNDSEIENLKRIITVFNSIGESDPVALADMKADFQQLRGIATAWRLAGYEKAMAESQSPSPTSEIQNPRILNMLDMSGMPRELESLYPHCTTEKDRDNVTSAITLCNAIGRDEDISKNSELISTISKLRPMARKFNSTPPAATESHTFFDAAVMGKGISRPDQPSISPTGR